MNEKGLAIIGVVVLFVGGCWAMASANEHAAIAQIALTLTVGAGVIVNLWKVGTNTEKTERIERSVNGVVEKRVNAAFKEAYARGIADGIAAEAERREEIAKRTAEAVAEVISPK